MSNTTIKEKIMTYMKQESKKVLSVEQLSEGLSLQKSTDFKLLVQTIAIMEQEGLLEFTKKGKVRLPVKDIQIEGTYRANERGFGFVTIDPEEDDVYIPKENAGFALDGDTVSIEITKPAEAWSDKGAEGRIVKVIKRAFTQIVGEFVPFDKETVKETELYGYVIPKDKKLTSYQVSITAMGIEPVEGAICVVELVHYPEKGYENSLEGIVKQVVGHKNDPGMDILSIVMQHGIPTEFPADVLKQADAVADQLNEEDFKNRQDRREQVTVTIDGEDAKDLDDAVTVKKLSNGHYFLGVHIADVSYYVTENSPLDAEAYDRATSVYLTDRVIPMLPHRLSNGICSLNPLVDRLTMSCEMEINQEGQVVHHEIFPSVIRTSARMTYTAVNEILEEKNVKTRENYQNLVPMFEQMGELHQILEQMRQRRGAISFEDHEAKILVDESGHPNEIVLRERGIGERMIESFMLAANETVAKHFRELKLPFIYRIHEQPKEEKVQRFFEFATNFGIVVKGTKEDISPKELQAVLDQVAGKPEEAVINTMLLRSMQQAKYSEDPYGHYGLAAEDYTHFTSPIRRYPDLIVHRLIRQYGSLPVQEEMKAKWAEELPDIADHSSKMERRAVEAERDTDALKKAEFMMDKVDEEFDGIISSITKFGMFVELPNTVEGLIHLKNLHQDYFHYLENHLALVGERTGVTYKIGQKVRIKVTRADPETKEIDFELLDAETVTRIEVPKKKNKAFSKNENKRQKNSMKKEIFDGKPKKGKKNKQNKKSKKPFYKEIAKKKKPKKKK